MMKYLLCLVLPIVVLSFDNTGETNEQKTTEAVVEAVTKTRNEVASKEDKEATAVAAATMDVIKKESDVADQVPDEIMEKAKQEAKETFKELDEAKVGTKASADAAAKVALAEVDGASDLQLGKGVKLEAEKAAVAAGKSVADHPNSESKALNEAVGEVQFENAETTLEKAVGLPGKVDIKKEDKGIVAKAKDAVSSLPKMAEGAVEEGVKEVPSASSPFGFVVLFAGAVALISIGYKYYEENISGGVGLNLGLPKFVNRSSFGEESLTENDFQSQRRAADCEFGEATYTEYKEMH